MMVRAIGNFDPLLIARSGQLFRWEELESGAVRFTAGDRRVTVRPAGEGTFAFSCEEAAFETLWRGYFDLNADYAAIGARIPREDAFLTAAYRYGRGLRILRQDAWEALASFIVSQNNNIPRIRASVQALSERFGERREDGEGTFFAFPTPAGLARATEDALRACGLGYRAAYIAALARETAEGRLDLSALCALEDESLRAALCALICVYCDGSSTEQPPSASSSRAMTARAKRFMPRPLTRPPAERKRRYKCDPARPASRPTWDRRIRFRLHGCPPPWSRI